MKIAIFLVIGLFASSSFAAKVPDFIRDGARENSYMKLYERYVDPHFCSTVFSNGEVPQADRVFSNHLLRHPPFFHTGFFGDQSGRHMENKYYQYTQAQVDADGRGHIVLAMSDNLKMYPISLEWDISFSYKDFVSAGVTPDNRIILFARNQSVNYVQRSYVNSLGIIDWALGPLGLLGSVASGFI